MLKKHKQEIAEKRLERLQLKKQILFERKNNSNFKKHQAKTLIIISSVVIFSVALITLGIKYSTKKQIEKAYEKDLSSIFEITPDMTIDDIIKFEQTKYGHTEYNLVKNINNENSMRLEFAPDEDYSSEICYKHYYFFTKSGLLSSVFYYDINDSARCNHITEIANTALDVAPNWDLTEKSNHYMYGNINNKKCYISYFSGYLKSINLIIGERNR